MKIQEAVEYLSEIANKSGCRFDILAGNYDSRGISVYNGALQNTEISNSCGIGIRLFKNQKPGYASTEKFSKESLEQMLADALSNSEYTEPINAELPSPVTVKTLPTYNSELETIDTDRLLNACLDIEKRILSTSEIKNVPDLGAEISSSLTVFANSNGILFTDNRNGYSIGAGAVAQRGDVVKMGWYNKSGRDFNDVNAEQISGEVISRAKELLSPRSITGGNIPIILSKRISSGIVSIYLSAFYAGRAQKGLSRLKGRIGDKIANEQFSLLSDPLREDLPGSRVMDNEGFPTSALSVVNNGVFENFLYNMESASKENRQSTGHGVRGFAGKAKTSFMNAIVPKGKLSNKDILSLFPKCILINHLEGSSGCHSVSGEISIGVQGFWCENGVPQYAVDNLTVSGNFFDLIQNIVGIGEEYNDSFSNIKVPSLAISDMYISA